MPKRTWTQEQVEALRRMYPDTRVSPEEMEQRFGRSWSAIRMKARRFGLERLREGSWSSEEIADLRRMYPDQGISLKQMVSHFERSETAIVNMAYEMDIKRRKVEVRSWRHDENEQLTQMYSDKSISPQHLRNVFGRSSNAITKQARFLGLARYNHQINHSYFEEITTDEQAYWLGWLAADGCVTVSQLGGFYISLVLHQKDKEIVQSFARAIAPGAAIHKYGNKVSLRIGDKKMAQDLSKYGIVPRKTEFFDWPNALPETFAMSFILGYFDGDGCLYKCKKPSNNSWTWYLLGTESFLKAARQRIETCAQVQMRDPVRVDRVKCPFLYKLYTCTKESIRRIDAVINASGLGLPRKHL